MSMELIDKRKLIEKVKTFHKWCMHTDNFPMIPSKRDNVGYLADDVLFGIDNEPTVKAVPIKQLEQMYDKFQQKLWREHEDVRGDDMIEVGYAEEFLQELLMEFGCWDSEVSK